MACDTGEGLRSHLACCPFEKRRPERVFLQSAFGLWPECGDSVLSGGTRVGATPVTEADVLRGDLRDPAQEWCFILAGSKQNYWMFFCRSLEAGGRERREGGSSEVFGSNF